MGRHDMRKLLTIKKKNLHHKKFQMNKDVNKNKTLSIIKENMRVFSQTLENRSFQEDT